METQILAAADGSLRQGFIEGGVAVELVPVRDWKGSVPKHITLKRIQRAWGWRGMDHNIADAVGIGDWYIRKQLKFEAIG